MHINLYTEHMGFNRMSKSWNETLENVAKHEFQTTWCLKFIISIQHTQK